MSRTWFGSDLHLRHHAILNYTDRGRDLSAGMDFDLESIKDEQDNPDYNKVVDIRAHDDWVISRINQQVKPQDYLYLLGDLVMAANQWYCAYMMSQIACEHIVLVCGNHDYAHYEFYRDCGLFEAVHQHRTEIKLNKKRLVLDHHPSVEWNNGHNSSWHLHGHSHGNFNYERAGLADKRILDVGWDNSVKVLGYYGLFSFEDVERYMEGRVSIEHHGKAD